MCVLECDHTDNQAPNQRVYLFDNAHDLDDDIEISMNFAHCLHAFYLPSVLSPLVELSPTWSECLRAIIHDAELGRVWELVYWEACRIAGSSVALVTA